jgi:hypothetical protein
MSMSKLCALSFRRELRRAMTPINGSEPDRSSPSPEEIIRPT